MCRSSGLAILLLLAAAWLAGCDEPAGEYLPASSIARKGFVRDHQSISELQGVQGGPVRLWGFVDHGNLYGDGRAKRVLAEWQERDGPDADTRRFDPKAEATTRWGACSRCSSPTMRGARTFLERFVADTGRGAPRRLYAGQFKFHAPTDH